MKSARARPRILAVAAACACATACSSPSEPHGSPILTQIYWVAGGTQSLAWSLDKDTTLVSPLPPFASEIDFVFDRRLDGAKIEDLVTMNGVTTAVPKEPPAVRVTWPDMGAVMSDPPFHLSVDYNSVPRFGGVSSYVFARPDEPGFPASTTLKLEPVPALLTGPYGDPTVLPDPPAVVKTSAFAALLVAATSPVVRSYQLPINFSNRLPTPPATSPHVHVTAHGAEVPYKLLADANLKSRWYVAAADCLGGWPANTTFQVTIDPDFPDAFGVKLGTSAAMTFSTGPGASAANASCVVPDAGAGDAAPDAPGDAAPGDVVDGSAPETGGPEVDAGADAGVDAAAEVAADPSDASSDSPSDAASDAASDAWSEAASASD
jgi:hypothetical protein